jgi:tripartite-type tricarboxylate transporter receptor subunit TctC
MRLFHRQFLRLAVGAAAIPAASRIARAQSYPTRPVRIVVGFPAGGGTDITARLTGQWLSQRLGQSFFVENRPGAGSNIAAETVVRAPADGYTLLLMNTVNTINTTLYDNLNFNFTRDIAPVANIIRTPLTMDVHPSVPMKTVADFIAYAKANPGTLNMGSAGNGTPQHVSGELFKMMTGVNMVHVPYRGGAAAVADLLAGHVQVMFDVIPESIEHIRAGRLRCLAVTTATRSDALPEIPTVGDFVPGYETINWWVPPPPRDTPTEIIDKLNKEINAGLSDPKMKARFADLGGTVVPGSSIEFGKLIALETEKWAKVIKFAGIKAD